MGYDEVKKALNDCDDIIAIALGGSRSRGEYRPDSDYDLFCVIKDTEFDTFRKNFRVFLENISSIIYAAEVFYLEHWGYLFKAIDNKGVIYDISIIPKKRINEMGIRSTNIIIKDTIGLYQSYICKANDELYSVKKIETQHFYDYATLFGFEHLRFLTALKSSDYWYAVRCIERMKNYLIRCDRVQKQSFSKTRSCPEREYQDIDDRLKKIYVLNGSMDNLANTANELCFLFGTIIQSEDACNRSKIQCC